jgi:hypothetical protein
MRQYTLKDWARRLAKCGKRTDEIAAILSRPEPQVKQWVGRIKPPRELAAWEDDYQPRPCTEPTSAAIGSRERVEIYRARMLSGEDLYHPQDSRQMAEPMNYSNTHRSVVSGIRVCPVLLDRGPSSDNR